MILGEQADGLAPDSEPRPSRPKVDTALVGAIRTRVAVALGAQANLGVDHRDALTAELVAQALADHATDRLARGLSTLTDEAEAAVAGAVIDAFSGLARLAPVLADRSWTDLHAVGGEPVIVDLVDGTKATWDPVAESDEDLVELMRTLGRSEAVSERRFDMAHPQINTQLRDGTRLFGVSWITARPHLFLRRHHHLEVSLDDLVRLGTMDGVTARFLEAAVRARMSQLVAGGQGVGKTTCLRALAACFGPEERAVSVETDFELGLDRDRQRHPDFVALEAREANVEGAGAVTCADLVRWSMRMAASRVCVGELLGGEVIPMLNAFHSGASGLSTIHANSSADALDKLAILALQAPERLDIHHTYALAARALDLVLFMDRTRDGHRVLASIREITGTDGTQVLTNELFSPGPEGRAVRSRVPISEPRRAALARAGYSEATR